MNRTERLNALFGLGSEITEGIAGEVVVDAHGRIQFGSRATLTQREAVDVAERLLSAVMASQWRDQIDEPFFRTSEAILQRSNGNLSTAIHAVRRAL